MQVSEKVYAIEENQGRVQSSPENSCQSYNSCSRGWQRWMEVKASIAGDVVVVVERVEGLGLGKKAAVRKISRIDRIRIQKFTETAR